MTTPSSSKRRHRAPVAIGAVGGVRHQIIMKTIPFLFGLLLCTSAMAADGALAHMDSSGIRTIALASIAAKYPEVNSKLVFDSIHYSLWADNAEKIDVRYRLPSPAVTKDQSTEMQKVTTRTETISVSMSISGKVENVSKGYSINTSAKTK